MESTQYKLLKRMCRCGYKGKYDLSRISTAQVMQYIKEMTGEEIVPIELLIHKMSMNYLKRTESAKWSWLPRKVAHGHLDHKGPGKHGQSLQYSDLLMRGIERLGINHWYGRLGRTWEEGLNDHTTDGNDSWYTAVAHGDEVFWSYWHQKKSNESVKRHQYQAARQEQESLTQLNEAIGTQGT
jgi:hypothetical protein